MFCEAGEEVRSELAAALHAALPEAESTLDDIAAEARREAIENTRDATGLITLIEHTRALSRR